MQSMTIRRLYWLTIAFGLIGFVSYFAVLGPTPAVAFLLGALGSFGNLWLFDWLSRAIGPGTASRKPWQAGTFITRYLLFFAFGYVIVKGLGVNPLPVVFGLLASTAAVLMSSIFELVARLFGSRFSR
jgi:uncharacterized membrane protein YedE/YeeE